MDEKYHVQIMIDMGKDIEAKVSYESFDTLTDASGYLHHESIYNRNFLRGRILWGCSIIEEIIL